MCDCLGALRPEHFHESLLYDGLSCWQDVYLITWEMPDGTNRDLYVKFKMMGGRVTLYLCSFHPEGWKKDEY